MEFEGTVFDILSPTTGTSARGEWQRQEVIFEMQDGQYSRKVAVTFFNKEAEVKSLVKGQSYTVSINLESREYNGRWYTNAMGWRVQAKAAAAAPVDESPFPVDMPFSEEKSTETSSSSNTPDDLPF